MHAHTLTDGVTGGMLTVIVLLGAAVAYTGPALANRRRRPWPVYRSVLWLGGLAAIALAILRPTGGSSPFVEHTVDHLLLGMLAPLLLAASAPVTLALRSLHPVPARRLVGLLRSPPAQLLAHPVTALLLNAGGLWVVYTTGIFASMHDNPVLLLLVHAHFLAAGYLFAAAVMGIEPSPHRPRHACRAAIMMVAIASHGILSKYLYAHPPAGVTAADAESGAILMYYAGDVIDAVLIVVLCAQWFHATRPGRPGSRLSRLSAGQGRFLG